MSPYANPINQILARADTFSRSEALIGGYILDHPEEVTSMTVRELASETGTSPATASRFARALGYRNFSAMRTALAIENSKVSPMTRDTRVSLDNMEDAVSFILENKIDELKDTAAAMDFNALREVVKLLRGANIVLIAAVGNTITIGMNAAFKLEQAGVRANCPLSTEAMTSAAVNLTDQDMMLVLTSSGFSKKLAGVYDHAEDAGCPIALITDNPSTPLAHRSSRVIRATVRDHVFSDRFHFSQNSMNFVIETLFLLLINNWEESEELSRMLDKHLLSDRQY